MRTLQPPSFVQVVLMITTTVNKHHHLVDVNRFMNKCVSTLDSTPWTVDVEPSLLIVTWEETGPSSREDSTEQLNSIAIGQNMSMDLETPMENSGWDLTTSTA